MDIIDLMIWESGTGGDLNLRNGDIETISGLSNQVYLAMFGGNIEQSTIEGLDQLDQRNDFWGNAYINEELQFNSEFEKTINQITLTSGSIQKIVNAAKKDLKYLQEYADIEVSGIMSGLNRFDLVVSLKRPDDVSEKIKFIWDAAKKELIEIKII